ncbi:MAG: thioredoxin domain-containing protein, partial [Chlamydiales bacterium]
MSQPEIHKNHLVGEKSLYLLQHMHNPVDWYPWGEKAFTAARVEDKPIFLSIGYATCHWCHVMEKESFQNKALAEMMNEVFINIKVDREEMPEIDSLYMEFAQAMMSGGAGWPLNVVLTPDLNPFFAATYLPPDSNRGLLGMRQLVLRIKQIWADPDERETVIVQAGKIVDVFSDHAIPPSTQIPAQEKIVEAAEMIFKAADPIYGGMKGTPKFPIGFQACFLLREARSKTESRALFYVERTLEMMHRGGIYDHLGGGFARYCIDEQWMVPHFEKMLYDNAILTRAYTEAYEFTRHNFYREIAEQTLEYVMRELRDGAGYFYCAEDADCGGKEGGYYTWTFEEIHKVLKEDASLFCEFYGASPTGNFHG